MERPSLVAFALNMKGGRLLPDISETSVQARDITYDGQLRNSADFPVLGVLYRGPSHGYDLCRELRDRLGEVWRLRTSHIYAVLSGLEKDGLARHERVAQETRPDKKIFSITDEGRRVFLEWLSSPVTNVRDLRMEFLAKFHFARLDSTTAVADLIAKQLSVCRDSQKCLKKNRSLCKTETELAETDFRLAMLEASVAWLLRLPPLAIIN
ncbi:MAG TPA: PadR family transcriptional regulator [Desulfomonilaceae bacterium]|nr:PadR family transcriptional regulator [Desulfomonilaceae bacterium]